MIGRKVRVRKEYHVKEWQGLEGEVVEYYPRPFPNILVLVERNGYKERAIATSVGSFDFI